MAFPTDGSNGDRAGATAGAGGASDGATAPAVAGAVAGSGSGNSGGGGGGGGGIGGAAVTAAVAAGGGAPLPADVVELRAELEAARTLAATRLTQWEAATRDHTAAAKALEDMRLRVSVSHGDKDDKAVSRRGICATSALRCANCGVHDCVCARWCLQTLSRRRCCTWS